MAFVFINPMYFYFIFDELQIALSEVPRIERVYRVALGGVPFLDDVKKTLLLELYSFP